MTTPAPSVSNVSSSSSRPASEAQRHYCEALGVDLEKGKYTSFHARVRREYRIHSLRYWIIAVFANGLLWVQIIVGAALTALGASDAPGTKTATVYLGASSTIIAGLLTYFKSRNQPNRSRQLRQSLKQVLNRLEQQIDEIRDLMDKDEAHRRATNIMKMYDDALREAATNYPDMWATMSDLSKHFQKSDDNSKSNAQKINSPSTGQNKPAPQPPSIPSTTHEAAQNEKSHDYEQAAIGLDKGEIVKAIVTETKKL